MFLGSLLSNVEVTMTIFTTNANEYRPIQALDAASDLYPPKMLRLLGGKSPPILYAMGNVRLLELEAIGFCGSRDVSDKGLSIAKDCARQAVLNGKVVISGNARGVDRAVHLAALESGGCTVLVLPEGIRHFRISKDFLPFWDWERALVISEFSPETTWQKWNAMKRNKTILSLVSAMIVIEAKIKGGTIAAGADALSLGVPLFVVNYENPEQSAGGKSLIDKGGHALNKNCMSGEANMHPVFAKMQSYGRSTQYKCVQGSLIT